MIYVGKLTEAEALLLEGQMWNDNEYFNPALNGDGVDWYISIEEMEGNTNIDFEWVATLPLIEYIPWPLDNNALPISPN